MNSQQLQPRTDPQPTTTTQPPATPPIRTPTDRVPSTFDHGNTDRLQNLIDECNAAFVDPNTN